MLISSIKSTAYKCIVRPVMEYASPVWHPHTAKNINALESVQRRAARWASNSRWIPSSHCWSKSSDECIQALKWPTIQQRHTYFTICCIHDSLHPVLGVTRYISNALRNIITFVVTK